MKINYRDAYKPTPINDRGSTVSIEDIIKCFNFKDTEFYPLSKAQRERYKDLWWSKDEKNIVKSVFDDNESVILHTGDRNVGGLVVDNIIFYSTNLNLYFITYI